MLHRSVEEAAGPVASLHPSSLGEDLSLHPRFHTYTLHSAALGNDRPVVVYLPEQYDAEPERRFATLYLHDGQNLFDGRLSYVPDRTWRADKTADELNRAGVVEPLILIGVANMGFGRMAEYTPTRDYKMGGGQGSLYGRLLCEELKPAIDALYRTQPGPGATGVAGSSLGGLISLYLGLEAPETFGRVGAMSPSIWWDHRSILNFVARARPGDVRVWLDMGMGEGLRHLRDTDHLHRLLVTRGWREGIDLAYARVPGAVHDEDAWANRFGEVLRFLFPRSPGP